MGVTEESERLRRLAQAVMSGELARDEFRRERRAVIDRYAGDAAMGDAGGSTQPNAARATDEALAVANGRGGRQRPAAAQAMRDPAVDQPGTGKPAHGDLWIGVVVVAAVLLVVGGVLAFFW